MRRQTDNRNYKMGYFNFIDYYRHKYALHKAKLHTCASGGQYKVFENKEVKIHDFQDKQKAFEVINECIEFYKATFPK